MHVTKIAVKLISYYLGKFWFGHQKGIRPVKTEWWGAGMVICLEWGADLHMAQLMPLPLTGVCVHFEFFWCWNVDTKAYT